MGDDEGFGIIVGVIAFIAFAVGIVVGGATQHKLWEWDAVKQGHAQYSQATGRWEWKEIQCPTP